MNKWEKEVAESLFNSEKEVLKALEKYYSQALSDIEEKTRILLSDPLTQSRVYRLNYQTTMGRQVSAILDKLYNHEYQTIQVFLNDTYNNGFLGTMYNLNGQGVPLVIPVNPQDALRAIMTDSKLSQPLYDALGVDINALKKRITSEITRGIAEGMSIYEISRNLHNAANVPLGRARTIARTESHRIQEAASYDAGLYAKNKGADLVKQWDAFLDGDTRDTHRELDGKIVELEEYFVSGTNKALYPGRFGDPAEDCNCRCSALKRARTALDADELKVLKERAEFFGLDKTKDFEDFKKKYQKAAESIENSEKYGIIKRENTGAISGAYNDKNDPKGEKREAHAIRYYEELRNSDKAYFVNAVSANSSIDKTTVSKAYKHIFEDKHVLDGELKYFDPDYYMAESLRRLRTNDSIQEHDLILLRHEALEFDIMQANPETPYDEAHAIADKSHNYKKALLEWLAGKGL